MHPNGNPKSQVHNAKRPIRIIFCAGGIMRNTNSALSEFNAKIQATAASDFTDGTAYTVLTRK